MLTVGDIPAGEVVKSADRLAALAVHCAITHAADGLFDSGDNAVGNSCNAEHRNCEHNHLVDRFLGVVPYGEGRKESHKTREEHRYALEECRLAEQLGLGTYMLERIFYGVVEHDEVCCRSRDEKKYRKNFFPRMLFHLAHDLPEENLEAEREHEIDGRRADGLEHNAVYGLVCVVGVGGERLCREDVADLEVSERCGHEQSAEHCDEKQQGDPRFCSLCQCQLSFM